MSEAFTFQAFVNDQSDRDVLSTYAKQHNLGDNAVMTGDISTAADFLASHSVTDVLVVEIPNAQAAPDLLTKLSEVCKPETKVIIVGDINEYSFFCWLQEIGIFHYLLKPLDENALAAMHHKLVTPPPGAVEEAKAPGKLISVLGARGGCGSTTISLLMAALAAGKLKQPIAFVDSNPTDGSASLFLDLEPSHGFKEAIEKPDRLDDLFIERAAVKATEHLTLFCSEEKMGEIVKYHEDAADHLAELLKREYHAVFVDMPHLINPLTKKILRLSDEVVLLTDMSLQALRDTMRMKEWLQEQLKIEHLHIVGNRVGHEKKHEVDRQDFEKTIGSKLDFSLPYEPEVFMEITHDLEVLEKTDTDGIKALTALTRKLLPALAELPGEEKNDKKKKKKKK